MNRNLTIAAFAASLLGGHALAQGSGSPFQLVAAKRLSISESSLKAAERKSAGSPQADKKSLAVGKTGRLVVRTGPEEDMLSFRIQGLRNPTLIAKPGSVLHILFVNSDEDMLHNMRFGVAKPPFVVTPSAVGTVGSADLPHEEKGKLSAQELAIKVPATPGTYSYLCTIKGHAKGGMFGTLVVR